GRWGKWSAGSSIAAIPSRFPSESTAVKRVLLVTYCWPPDPSVGSLRPAKLARSLSHHGWGPIVVTVRGRHRTLEPDDGTNAAMVVPTPSLANPVAWYQAVKAWLYALVGKRRESAESRLSWTPEKAPPASRESTPARIKRTLLSLLHTPDAYLGWLPFAILASVRAAWTHRVHGLVSTGPPFTAH